MKKKFVEGVQMTRTLPFMCLLVALVLGASPAYAQQANVPLKQYHSAASGDSALITTVDEPAAQEAFYQFFRVDGFVFSAKVSGTVPLKLYYLPDSGDAFVTATNEGARDAANAGYWFIRDQGFVYSKSKPGTVALKLYYSDFAGDNLTTASAAGEAEALAAGYRFVRIEGYIFPAQ